VSMKLNEIGEKLQKVIEIYSDRFQIKRDTDWFILKIQEELGELVSAHLKLTERARKGTASLPDLEKNLEDEVADVIAMTILFARNKGIDVEEAIKQKWFKHL
jgi:NTP pyrophosphatase (non-canonical NTP hydrolase)